jgi:hypothetical protein
MYPFRRCGECIRLEGVRKCIRLEGVRKCIRLEGVANVSEQTENFTESLTIRVRKLHYTKLLQLHCDHTCRNRAIYV